MAAATDLHDAAWNAVAYASLAYQQEVQTLTYYLARARDHGFTVPELCHASGLDEAFVTRLLEEAG